MNTKYMKRNACSDTHSYVSPGAMSESWGAAKNNAELKTGCLLLMGMGQLVKSTCTSKLCCKFKQEPGPNEEIAK